MPILTHNLTSSNRLILALAFCLTFFCLSSVQAQVPCNIYDSSTGIPDGFGASYNLFSAGQELLLRPSCSGASSTIEIGSGAANQYIYKDIYVYRAGAWQTVDYTAPGGTTGEWLIGKAKVSLTLSSEEQEKGLFIAAYICQWNGTKWNCGCRDKNCNIPYWQLQKSKTNMSNVCSDTDQDGYGNPASANCTHPQPDCDDNNSDINPGANDICGNNIDENCDGTDNSCAAVCDDKDGDGYGACPRCNIDQGCKYDGDDCDDLRWFMNPGAPETCDNYDNNCSAGIDEGCDNDGDGYCDKDIRFYNYPAKVCPKTNLPDDSFGNDCDDTVTGINPAAEELCNNNIDDNCNGQVDENCACQAGETQTCGIDTGECQKGSRACEDGYWGPCQGSIEPTTETCDSVDNDCDGQTDEGCNCVNNQTRQCGTDTGECRAGTQTCTDDHWDECVGSQGPAAEICGNGLDEDCNGETDNGCDTESPQIIMFDIQTRTTDSSVDAKFKIIDNIDLSRVELWRAPYEAGSCDETTKNGCAWGNSPVSQKSVSGQVNSGSLTDNSPIGVYYYGLHAADTSDNYASEPYPPGPIKVTVNSAASCTDNDSDYYIKENTPISACQNICGELHNRACLGNNDCNDNEYWANPGNPNENCDTIDNNCNSQTDENCDNDHDGYCNIAKKVYRNNSMCPHTNVVNYTEGYSGDDCNDENSAIHPGAEDPCGDNIDQDCSGADCPGGCIEAWKCNDWSACVDNNQTRSCWDTNECGTIGSKPTESQSCTVACTPDNSCASNTCVGNTCQDSCGNSYDGEKPCGIDGCLDNDGDGYAGTDAGGTAAEVDPDESKYFPVYNYQQNKYFCSQSTNLGGAYEVNAYPCSQGPYINKYTKAFKGFKDLYNFNDPKIFCGMDYSQIGDCAVSDTRGIGLDVSTLNIPERHNVVSKIADAYKIFIPPGTTRISIHPEVFDKTDQAIGYRYKTPLDHFDYARMSDVLFGQGDSVIIHNQQTNQYGSLLDVAQQRDVYGRNSQMPIGVVSSNYMPVLSVEQSGWLYTRIYKFGYSGLKDLDITLTVDVTSYREWYSKVKDCTDPNQDPSAGWCWDADGNPAPQPPLACDTSDPNYDCNDANTAVHPNASEICGNGIDDDCRNGDASCACTNECSSGETGCVNATTKYTCGEAGDGDSCLDKIKTACGSSETCSAGYCGGSANCESQINYQGEIYPIKEMPDGRCWLAKNLNVGARINGVNNMNDNGIIEKYCYDDSEANCSNEGGLYSLKEATQYDMTAGARGICPNGWHIPSDQEWINLLSSLGCNNAGSANNHVCDGLGWEGNKVGGLVNLLPGLRYDKDGRFVLRNKSIGFWTSTYIDALNGMKYGLRNWISGGEQSAGEDHRSELGHYDFYYTYGNSIRCVKDGGTSCTTNWDCAAWSACVGGTQTRICTDSNNCGTTVGKPAESQSCGGGGGGATINGTVSLTHSWWSIAKAEADIQPLAAGQDIFHAAMAKPFSQGRVLGEFASANNTIGDGAKLPVSYAAVFPAAALPNSIFNIKYTASADYNNYSEVKAVLSAKDSGESIKINNREYLSLYNDGEHGDGGRHDRLWTAVIDTQALQLPAGEYTAKVIAVKLDKTSKTEEETTNFTVSAPLLLKKGTDYLADRLIVRFFPGTFSLPDDADEISTDSLESSNPSIPADIVQTLVRTGVAKIAKTVQSGIYVLYFSDSADIDQAKKDLAASPYVVSVYYDYIPRLYTITNPAVCDGYNYSYHTNHCMQNGGSFVDCSENYNGQWNLLAIDMPDAWSIWGKDYNNNANVVIFDSFDKNHGAHVAGIACNLCTSSNYPGFNTTNPPTNYSNLNGSHFWGILPTNRNSNYCRGVDGSIGSAGSIETIEKLDNYGSSDAINMSFGRISPAITSVLEKLYQQGVAMLAATGNDGDHNHSEYPSASPYVIAIGATDEGDTPAVYSNSWTNGNDNTKGIVEVVAPGTHVISDWRGGSDYSNLFNRYTDKTALEMTGTSMAAPHVTGLAGMIISILKDHGTAKNADRVEKVRGMIDFTADDIATDNITAALSGQRDYVTGYGRINAGRAMQLLHDGHIGLKSLVVLCQNNDCVSNHYTTVSDPDSGEFSITGISPGNYAVYGCAVDYNKSNISSFSSLSAILPGANNLWCQKTADNIAINGPVNKSIDFNIDNLRKTPRPACTSVTTSDWNPDPCSKYAADGYTLGGTQSRYITGRTPSNCVGGNIPDLVRSCTYLELSTKYTRAAQTLTLKWSSNNLSGLSQYAGQLRLSGTQAWSAWVPIASSDITNTTSITGSPMKQYTLAFPGDGNYYDFNIHAYDPTTRGYVISPPNSSNRNVYLSPP